MSPARPVVAETESIRGRVEVSTLVTIRVSDVVTNLRKPISIVGAIEAWKLLSPALCAVTQQVPSEVALTCVTTEHPVADPPGMRRYPVD